MLKLLNIFSKCSAAVKVSSNYTAGKLQASHRGPLTSAPLQKRSPVHTACIIFCSLRSAMFLAMIHSRVIIVLFRDRRLNYVMWSTRRNILVPHVAFSAA